MQWLTSKNAAERMRRDVSCVQRAASNGELHGHQRVDSTGKPLRHSRWLFHPDAVDAWIRGANEDAQKEACGCANLGRRNLGRKLTSVTR